MDFASRHIGPSAAEQNHQLSLVGAKSLEDLLHQAVPEDILLDRPLDMPPPVSETEALAELAAIANRNRRFKSLIGLGYHGCIVPPPVQRHLMENPGWYTSYTPYQAEISQGRLEMLFHFQTLVCELAGLDVANASLLDEPTAVAEAAAMAVRHSRGKRCSIWVAGALHPQTLDVLDTRAGSLGLDIADSPKEGHTAAALLPWPNTEGIYPDPAETVEQARELGALVVAVADPLALSLLAPPSDFGADIVVGSMQRFGVPMGYGGPHAAFMAAREDLVRLVPGRIVGRSVDARGAPAYRLALQTREQHIRREKATSNICTAQALLANMAAAYAIWHGPDGLAAIARRVHAAAARLAAAAEAAGRLGSRGKIFDSVCVEVEHAEAAVEFRARGYEPRVLPDSRLGFTFDETTTEEDVRMVASMLRLDLPAETPDRLPAARRERGFLTQRVFHEHRSETAMTRYLTKLAHRDLALDRTMIPLGSCTMKLNAAAEMAPIGWPDFAELHPFTDADNATGYAKLRADLEAWLCEITGFDAISLQPNAGSQGEYAGLRAIRRYHEALGEGRRSLCLIPDSAHGTNPASAAMAGLDVVSVASHSSGEIDMDDLAAKARQHRDEIAACMVTYPSTRGVFETGIRQLCDLVHEHGGQVYLDGANLNAMAGVVRPGDVGADVCHMNLHKTFCIPHGGGGPGMGPIGVKSHLTPYLPGHWTAGTDGAVSGAPMGSAGILPITWMYLRMMGGEGLRRATASAILSANYVSRRLADIFPTAFATEGGLVAHECVLDPRGWKEKAGITAEDIAKRLIDYGFHGPTMDWPVAGTLMVEPTESEPLAEIDRFCDAMLSIADEIKRVAEGEWPSEENPLARAPHTLGDALEDPWTRPYPRCLALLPTSGAQDKYLPPVARVDSVYGDRNLVCREAGATPSR